MRGPHPGCQTFAADVAQRKDYAAARLLHREKVTGQVTNGENFAGNFEVAVPDQTRGTQAPVHLRSFEERGVQIDVILLKRRELRPPAPAGVHAYLTSGVAAERPGHRPR